MYKTRQERPYRPPLPGSDSRRGSMVPPRRRGGLYGRPYGEDGAFARKNCRVRHPALFRGNWCGLRESPRRRNALRFYCPARSNEGAGGTGQDILVERNCLRDAASDDARRGAQGGPGAAAPGAFWGLFRGEKSPAGGSPAGAATAAATRGRFAARTRDARYLRSRCVTAGAGESPASGRLLAAPTARTGRGGRRRLAGRCRHRPLRSACVTRTAPQATPWRVP